MSPEFRGGLTVAAVAGAFMAGYFLKPTPAIPTVVAQAPVQASAPAAAPAAEVPLIIPPVDDQVKPAAAVNPNDPALKMIGDALGIKTTSVLAEVEKRAADGANSPPVFISPSLIRPASEPAPMGGPMPRLEPPPMPATPLIDELPVQRPAPCGTIRITIRDQNGHVTSVNTAERLTIEVAPADVKPGGPEVGPMPREVGESVSDLRRVPRFGTFTSIGVKSDAENAEPIGLLSAALFNGAGAEHPTGTALDLILYLQTEDIEDNEGSGVWFVVGGEKYSRERLDHMIRHFISRSREYDDALHHPTEFHYRRFEETLLLRNRLEVGARVSAVCSGGRSLIHLLTDPDWKPSAAPPDSTRWVVDPPSLASPFDGATDIVPPPPPPSSTVAHSLSVVP
jgi:hypothetical protein